MLQSSFPSHLFINAAPLHAQDFLSWWTRKVLTLLISWIFFHYHITRAPIAAVQPVMSHSPTIPSFPTLKNRRATMHSRRPSYSTLPIHKEKDTFNTSGQLDAFLNLSLNDPRNPMFVRAKPASLGSSASIHARMARNHKKTGSVSASAPFLNFKKP